MAESSASPGRFARTRSRVRGWPGGHLIWRIGITVIGVAVVAVGILLVPLPGPGWVVIFGGLGILATEYVWAARLLAWGKAKFLGWTAWLGRQPRWVLALVSFVGLVLLAAVGFGMWWFFYR